MEKEELQDATPIVPSSSLQVVEALQIPQQRIIFVPERADATSDLRRRLRNFCAGSGLTPVYKRNDPFVVVKGSIFLGYTVDPLPYQNITFLCIRYVSKKKGNTHEIWVAKGFSCCCCGPFFDPNETVTIKELDRAIAIIDLNEEEDSSDVVMTRA